MIEAPRPYHLAENTFSFSEDFNRSERYAPIINPVLAKMFQIPEENIRFIADKKLQLSGFGDYIIILPKYKFPRLEWKTMNYHNLLMNLDFERRNGFRTGSFETWSDITNNRRGNVLLTFSGEYYVHSFINETGTGIAEAFLFDAQPLREHILKNEHRYNKCHANNGTYTSEIRFIPLKEIESFLIYHYT